MATGPKENVPLEFTSTDAPIEDHGVKMGCHAPAGFGKTVLAATMPGEMCIVSAESGLLSLQPANLIRLFGAARKIPVIKVKSKGDFIEAYELLAGQHGSCFQSIAIDSASEVADIVLETELRRAKDPRQAYGELQTMMAKYFRLFRDLPGKHVYMSFKQDRLTDQTGMTLARASMPGKNLIRDVPHYFDEMFALCVGKNQAGQPYRYLRTQPDLQFDAKDRSGALAEIEEPNLTKIISKIRNVS